MSVLATTWPEAAIWIAVILGVFGTSMAGALRRRSDPGAWKELRDASQSQKEILSELSALREELSALRGEVAELDRVLKTVE